MDAQPIPLDQDLSQLEWDGNEVYLDASSNDEVKSILTQALGSWLIGKESLKINIPRKAFICLPPIAVGMVYF